MADQRPTVLKHRRTTLERAEKFVNDENSTVNLLSRLYPAKAEISHLDHYAAPGRISYNDAMEGSYQTAKIGDTFGPLWSTHWFRLSVNIPSDWLGKQVVLRWNSGSEALLWKKGQPIQGFSSINNRCDYTISSNLMEDELDQQFHVEMACNGLFGAGKNGLIQPPDDDKQYSLIMAELSVIDPKVKQLLIDMKILIDIVKSLPETNRSYQALYCVNHIVNLCQIDQPDYDKALEIAQNFFNVRNGGSQMLLHAMGHCHIDTAWLWPYAETKRKCARSWSNACQLMKKYPEFIFVCSQAQQYEWIKEDYPQLFKEIKHFVNKAVFIPTGGTWVEMDGNLPSGESFIRQFLYGQRFFMKEFNIKCQTLWLPDTFGYSAQLPQICNHVGIHRFLTQKISWSLLNKFPHHTFYWAGIDNSEVLVHFPPGDDYCSPATVSSCVKTLNNFRDKGRSNHAALVYGHGDGGQGPTEDMLKRIDRLKDCDGVPKITTNCPDEFFRILEAEDDLHFCKWVGELFLELHNATYTTQAEIKKENRFCEFRLQFVEFLTAIAYHKDPSVFYDQIHSELARAWKLLLLNQFHDVLPGSCIQDVVKDALKFYKEIHDVCDQVLDKSVKKLFTGSSETPVIFNSLSWSRLQVITIPEQIYENRKKRSRIDSVLEFDCHGERIALVEVPSYGYSPLEYAIRVPKNPVLISKKNDRITMENGYLQAVIDSYGRVVELYAKSEYSVSKNLFSEEHPGNEFVIYDDVPLFWDAWDVMDYHMETRHALKDVDEPIQAAMIVDDTSVRVSAEVALKISDSGFLKQTIVLDADSPALKFHTEVEWHENHKFLKVEFPAKIVADTATYEIQFGHLRRPTHYNTSWDMAKFEVCGHKFFDLSQYDLGLSVLNNSKYGMSCRDNVMRLSLLRSPKAPDAKADMGCHEFTYALQPHLGTFQSSSVIKQAYMLNSPLLVRHLACEETKSYFSVDQDAVVLETVKPSEDQTGVLVLRLYESFGSDCVCTLSSILEIKDAKFGNGLEEIERDAPSVLLPNGRVSLVFKPFQIRTLLIQLQ